MRTWIHIVFAISLLALMFPQVVRAAFPAAISPLVGSFVQQTDDVFGYQMLVPATWEEVNLGDARGYIPTNTGGNDNQILLTVTNAHALAGNGSNMTFVGLELLKQQPSLSAWTQFQERFWQTQNIQYERVLGPLAAKIYLLTPMADQIQLVAYMVYQGKLLVASLYGSGIYGSKEQLVSKGLFTDFALMVESLEAIETTASKAIAADDLVSITSSVDRTTGTKYVGDYHCHDSTCGYDESYRMITRWDPTRDMIERLYEEHWYRHSDLRYSWLYNTYVTNDTYPCEAGATLLFRSIGKHTSASQYKVSDDWYPYRIDTRLRTSTYHVMNFGDNAIRWCAVYQPFY